jgi:hypothetical protein
MSEWMIRKLLDGKPRLLEIDNVHAEDSGQPPSLETGDYVGYFENSHGEQWVFVGDRARKTAALWGGDAGWAGCHLISADELVPDVVLNHDESWWLITCWAAMLHRKVEEVASDWDKQAMQRAERMARRLGPNDEPEAGKL